MASSLNDSTTEEPEGNALAESEATAKSDLFVSGTTSPTDTGSLSGEESFLEALGADFRTLACSLRVTAGGVANFVHRSAMNVAAEIARLEEEEEDRTYHQHHHQQQQQQQQQQHQHSEEVMEPSLGTDQAAQAASSLLNLPWEIFRDGSDVLQDNSSLKERILALSADDTNFLRPLRPHEEQNTKEFELDEPRLQLIRRLLEFDENLARTHTRLSHRSDVQENEFWKNYFDRCEEERKRNLEQSLCDDQESIQSPNSLVQADSDGNSQLLNDNDEEDSSFVLPSPPMSGNSADVRSVDSLVFVDVVKHPRES